MSDVWLKPRCVGGVPDVWLQCPTYYFLSSSIHRLNLTTATRYSLHDGEHNDECHDEQNDDGAAHPLKRAFVGGQGRQGERRGEGCRMRAG